MFYQTDPRLKFDADSDCYLFDVLYILEQVGKFKYTLEDVAQIRKLSVKIGFIEEDGYLNAKGISGIATVSSGFTGRHVYARRMEPTDIYNWLIAWYQRTTDSGKLVTHFVVVDINDLNKVIFDPWSEYGSKTVREGKIVDYRYIWAEIV